MVVTGAVSLRLGTSFTGQQVGKQEFPGSFLDFASATNSAREIHR